MPTIEEYKEELSNVTNQYSNFIEKVREFHERLTDVADDPEATKAVLDEFDEFLYIY